MESQLIAAMLVILFFLLYKEHKNGQKRLEERLSEEINRLKYRLQMIDDSVNAVGDKVDTVYTEQH